MNLRMALPPLTMMCGRRAPEKGTEACGVGRKKSEEECWGGKCDPKIVSVGAKAGGLLKWRGRSGKGEKKKGT